MQAHYNVLAPGPVNLHPEVEKTLSLPMIHHRTPEFDAILKRVLLRIKKVFCTDQHCFLLNATGSGAMEAAIVNTLNPGAGVLGIDSGKFGERWSEMAKLFGAELVPMKVAWGEAVSVDKVKEALQKNPKIELVLCQACETSTAVKHPIKELAALIQHYPQCLFLVDGITALGAYPIPMDEWGIDVLIGGSQKAFMLPTGLSFISFSNKAWGKVEANPQPRYYFDMRREKAANLKGETFFSSNVTLIRALDVVLEMLLQRGLPAHYYEIAERARFTREFGTQLGFSLFSKSYAESVTALTVPSNIDSQVMRQRLEEKHKITIMGGQDQAKGKILRIGHMGYIQTEQMITLMLCLADILREVNHQAPLPDVQAFEKKMREFWHA